MNPFEYRDNQLYAEQVSCAEIANAYGTPSYVYSKAAIEDRYRAFEDALQNWQARICYSVKANSSLAVLSLLARLGAGFDIVSGGELERVLRAGGDARKVVFSGVAKRADEIRRSLLAGIYCFNIESLPELDRIEHIAGEMDIPANVSLRVNPDVDADTHPYISTGQKENKFGLSIDQARELYQRIADSRSLRVTGVDCHIGSQLLDLAPFRSCFEKVFELVDWLEDRGIPLRHVDLGGGLGIPYTRADLAPAPVQYARTIEPFMQGRQLELVVEPGRSIVGHAGLLLCRVEYLKSTDEGNFALVDAGMNDFMRPSLYSAWHEISAVHRESGEQVLYDVAGPVCESADVLGRQRSLCIRPGSLLAVHDAGAYGFAMASNYNSRMRPAEVLVDGDLARLIRKRESIDQLFADEIIPD